MKRKTLQSYLLPCLILLPGLSIAQDLRPRWDIVPAQALPGETIQADLYVINNDQNSAGPSRMEYYLSNDNVFSTNDTYLGFDAVSGISDFDTEDENVSLTIPANLSCGNYFLLAVADIRDEVSETNENNNVKASALQVCAESCEAEDIDLSMSWDWRQERYQTHTFTYGSQQIDSPWESVRNLNNNIIDFVNQPIKDYEPTEGWVLLQRDFGTQANPTNHPYFILYNRYTGILRFFIALSEVHEGYSEAEITMAFAQGSDRSAVLEHFTGDEFRSALDRFDNQISITKVGNDYATDHPEYWQHADFVMNYDPCACNNSSQLEFKVKLIDNANLQFTLKGQATSQSSINSIGQNNRNGVNAISQRFNALNSGLAAYNSAHANVKKAKQTYNELLTSHPNIVPTIPNGLANTLSNLGAVFPYVGLAKFLVTAVTGEPNSPQQISKPMVFDINLQATGTIVSTDIGVSRVMDLPGTDIQSENSVMEYNGPLGVFSLNTTPVIHYGLTIEDDPEEGDYYDHHIKLAGDLDYSINPAAGFDLSKSEIKAAIVVRYGRAHDFSLSGWPNVNINGYNNGVSKDAGLYLIGTNDDASVDPDLTATYSTGFVPINCLDESHFRFRNHTNWAEVFVKVVASFEAPDGKKYIYTATYDVESNWLMDGDYPTEEGWGPENDFTGCFGTIEPNEVHLFCETSRYQQLMYGVELGLNDPIEENPEGSERLAAEEIAVNTELMQSLLVYPNPSSDFVSIEVVLNQNAPLAIELYSITGVMIRQVVTSESDFPSGKNQFQLDASDLADGVYFLKVNTPQGTQMERVVVAH